MKKLRFIFLAAGTAIVLSAGTVHISHGADPAFTSPGVKQKAQDVMQQKPGFTSPGAQQVIRDVAIPHITGVRDQKYGNCTKTGSDLVIISGRNFGGSRNKAIVIGIPGIHYHPTVLNWSNEQIRVWIKSPGLQRGRAYPVAIETAGHSRVLSNADVLVNICSN